jgi:DNA-binding NtrC family response regulator
VQAETGEIPLDVPTDSRDAAPEAAVPKSGEITLPVSIAPTAVALPELRLPVDLPRLLRETEEAYIRLALEQSSGNKKEAARLLGMGRTTLVEKLRRKAAASGEKLAIDD